MGDRARAGFERGPCPGCKRGTTHPKGDVCSDCRKTLTDARAIIDAHQRQVIEAWYQYAERAHWNPGFYIQAELPNSAREGLHAAMHELVLAAATATHFPGGYDLDMRRNLKLAGRPLIERPKGLPSRRDAHQHHVLMSRRLANAINAVDIALIEALSGVGATEYENGSNMLRKLVVGDVTADDFNRQVATRVASIREQERVAREALRKAATPTEDDNGR